MEINFANSSPELNYNLAILKAIEHHKGRAKTALLPSVKAIQKIIMELEYQPYIFLSATKVFQLEFENADGDYLEFSINTKSKDKDTCKGYLEYSEKPAHINKAKAMIELAPYRIKELVQLFMEKRYDAIETIFTMAGGQLY